MGRFQGWAAFVCAVAIALSSIASTGTAHAATRSPIASPRPAWATAANRVGAFDGRTRIAVRIYLQLRDRAGLDAVAAAVSTPGSAQYRQFLTTAQVRERYAPTAQNVAAVRSWLTANGLRVTGVPIGAALLQYV